MAGKTDQSKKLDHALEETFPASDPPTAGKATGTEPPRRPMDRLPPKITKDDIERAEGNEEEPPSREHKEVGRRHHTLQQGGQPDENATPEPVPKDTGKNRARDPVHKGQGAEGFSKGYGGSEGKGTGAAGPEED